MSGPVMGAIAQLDFGRCHRAFDSGETIIAPLPSAAVLIASYVHGLSQSEQRPPLVILTANNGEDLYEELTSLLPDTKVNHFPSWETLPHERLSPQSDTVARRFATLQSIRKGHSDVVVVPVRSFIQPFIRGFGSAEIPIFHSGQSMDMASAIRGLLKLGYTRTDLVEKRGEFAQRGGIIDLFPPQAQHPVRVEFFDDVIDEVRFFSVADQRSLHICSDPISALPAREILITDQVRARAAELAATALPLADAFQRISEGIPVEGMESLMPALVNDMESFVELLPQNSRIISVGPELIRNRSSELIRTGAEFLEASWLNAAAGNQIPIDLRELERYSFHELEGELERARSRALILSEIAPFGGGESAVDSTLKAVEPFRANSDRLIEFVREKIGENWSILMIRNRPWNCHPL